MRNIKFRYRLKLVSDDWRDYKKGDIGTFYMSLNDKQNGLYRFAIDERWDVVSCDEFTGIKDKNGTEIYEDDIVIKFYGDHSVKKRLQGFEGVVQFGEFELTTDSWGITHKCYGWHLEFDDKSGCTAITNEMEIIGNIYQKEWKEKLK